MTTVKELIIKLLDCDMTDEVIVRWNVSKKQLKNIDICTRPGKGLGALFG